MNKNVTVIKKEEEKLMKTELVYKTEENKDYRVQEYNPVKRKIDSSRMVLHPLNIPEESVELKRDMRLAEHIINKREGLLSSMELYNFVLEELKGCLPIL